LSQLPADLPLPVVVAQHISAGFIGGLIKWLDDSSPLTVKLAQSGLPLEAGVVYFAPDDHHLKVARQQGKVCALLDQGPAIDGFRPSATPLLESVAQTCPGHAIGALLTGMGADGARGLLAMRDAGCVTFVQDEASSVVFGMPAAALALNAAEVTVALDAMPDYLKRLLAGSR
jgi:two-component system chemotaxis response regulator CheB